MKANKFAAYKTKNYIFCEKETSQKRKEYFANYYYY